MRNTQNPSDELLILHNRLLDEDPTATVDIFDAVAHKLEGYLRYRFPDLAPGADPYIYVSAVYDTLTDYFKNPGKFDPDKRGLMGYLRMAAYRDMQNLFDKERRHAKRRTSLDDVEFSASDGNDFSSAVIDRIETQRIRDELSRDMTGQEVIVFDLMVKGERSTEVAADALRIAHLPLDQQKREVKRIKDRITRRIRRRGLPTQ